MDPNQPTMAAKKVAVFDNNPAEIEMIEMLLNTEGYNVQSAMTSDFLGKEAEYEAFILSFDPNVILWSVDSTSGSMWDFFKSTTNPDKPCMKDRRVVILTALVEKEIEKMTAETKDYILRKPFDIDDLIKLVNEEPDQELNDEINKETKNGQPRINGERAY
ncbi:MAG: response regulator [Candidatus Roizmanbacteria bacterium]|nr:MAG: response regulator [Candidatus Roizmanbacteria bacterium]